MLACFGVTAIAVAACSGDDTVGTVGSGNGTTEAGPDTSTQDATADADGNANEASDDSSSDGSPSDDGSDGASDGSPSDDGSDGASDGSPSDDGSDGASDGSPSDVTDAPLDVADSSSSCATNNDCSAGYYCNHGDNPLSDPTQAKCNAAGTCTVRDACNCMPSDSPACGCDHQWYMCASCAHNAGTNMAYAASPFGGPCP
jgi:hypothetical protein